jgi:uncharacterized protein (TIGR02118 family)
LASRARAFGDVDPGEPAPRSQILQSHTQADWFPFLAGAGPLYDGVAEVWCEGIEDAQQLFAEPKFAQLIAPDEENFLDTGKTVILLMTEHVVYQRSGAPILGGVKLFELPVRRRDMTRVECQRYWRDVHGPLVLGAADMIAPLRRYVQSHCLADGSAGLPPMRYDGMAELWFDTIEDLRACFGPQYMKTVPSRRAALCRSRTQRRHRRKGVPCLRARLAHDPEKWIPVFRQRSCANEESRP